jgi:hypothetical protein
LPGLNLRVEPHTLALVGAQIVGDGAERQTVVIIQVTWSAEVLSLRSQNSIKHVDREAYFGELEKGREGGESFEVDGHSGTEEILCAGLVGVGRRRLRLYFGGEAEVFGHYDV